MEHGSRVVLKNAYRQGSNIYTKMDGVPYLVDTGTEVSMTRGNVEVQGHLKITLSNGKVTKMPYGNWKKTVRLLGPYNMVSLNDLDEWHKKGKKQTPVRNKLRKLLCSGRSG